MPGEVSRAYEGPGDEPSAGEYVPVPVEAAREISQRYAKSIVVVVAWDPVHQRMHTTSYGATAPDKVAAAKLVELIAAASYGGKPPPPGSTHEDFRRRTQAEWAQQREMLLDAAKVAVQQFDGLSGEGNVAAVQGLLAAIAAAEGGPR